VIASPPPEVLVLTPDFPPDVGGIQTLVLRLSSELTRFRPRVVTRNAAGGRGFDGRLPFSVSRSPALAGRLDIVALNAFGLAAGLRRRPSVILSAHIVTGPAALALGKALGRPVVQYVHALEVTRRPELARRVLRGADAIVAVSRYSRSLAERVTGGAAPVRIVPPGVDAPAEPPDLPMRDSSIVVVARLSERYKGHDVLLRGLSLVAGAVPAARLDVVGDGPLRAELQSLASSLGVDDRVTFHGNVTDARRDEILRAATVFAMPSRLDRNGAGEGFGIAYVEAGAAGLPVVAGNVGGATDAVVDGVTGVLVDPGSPEAVAAALVELLTDQAEARMLGLGGWARARSLSWHSAAVELESVLAEVASR
jgi:phosphatidylinositol alpha-1,6-mannosyltransferase